MYDHVVVQVEDFVDYIKSLYAHFDSLLMFDHSCSHDWG